MYERYDYGLLELLDLLECMDEWRHKNSVRPRLETVLDWVSICHCPEEFWNFQVGNW
jgi:hypothetical protein